LADLSDRASLDVPPSWSLALRRILEAPGVVLVVGGTDSGKTTFCKLLARTGAEAGLRVSFVDADIGQSTVGPPGCIGWATVSKQGALTEKALWFIGTYSPAGHLPEVITGTRTLVARALRSKAELVVVDSTGLVRGWTGYQLKTAKAQILRPRHLAIFAGQKELGPLPLVLSTLRSVRIHRLRVPAGVRKRDPAERRAYRETRFREFFSECSELTFAFPDLFLWGRSWYRPGTPLTEAQRVELERRLQITLAHAERKESMTFVVRAARELERYAESVPAISRRGVRLLPVETWKGRLCAVEREPGDALAVGKLLSVDFKTRTVRLLGRRLARGRGRILKIGAEVPV